MNVRSLFPLVLAAAAGAGGMWLWQRPQPVAVDVKVAQEADLSGLQAQLQRVAEKGLKVPTLETRSLLVKVPGPELKARFLATMKLAETLGGVARQGLDRHLARVVLATVPAERLELFLAAAEVGRLEHPPEEAAGTELVDCEVVLLPE